jgi:hypothetical protein
LRALSGRVSGAVRFHCPSSQKQTQNDTQNQLFLPGQPVHATDNSIKRAASQRRSMNHFYKSMTNVHLAAGYVKLTMS